MRKNILPFSLACIAAVLMILNVNAGDSKTAANLNNLHSIVKKSFVTVDANSAIGDDKSSAERTATKLYDSLQLEDMGLSKDALLYAYKGYQYLVDKGRLVKDNIITICDFSQSSRKKRLYVIDVKNFKVLMNTYVAHGRNSGVDFATKFSNQPESLESSLGFYVTEGTYFGKHGLSLRINGLEKGWNDLAEERAVVIHRAEYVGAHRVNSPYMGRSFGCPAVPENEIDKLIDIIKDGTCLFIFHPTDSYLHESKILNG